MFNKKRIIVFLSCLFFILIIVVIILFAGKPNDTRHSKSSENNPIDKMIAKIYKENEYSEECPEFDYYNLNVAENMNAPTDIDYDNRFYYCLSKYIDKEYIGEKLGVDEESGAEIYKIEHMTEKMAVAVKDSEKDIYYTCFCEDYRPDTFEQFLEETGFYDAADIMFVYMSSIKDNKYSIMYYDGFDYLFDSMEEFSKNAILSEYTDKANTGLSFTYYMSHIKFMVIVEFLENGDVSLTWNYMSGYFSTNGKGIEYAEGLMEYLVENGKAYIDYYDK